MNFFIRVILNVGWCSSYDETSDHYLWLRSGDYNSTGESNVIQLPLKKQVDWRVDYQKELNVKVDFHKQCRSCIVK